MRQADIAALLPRIVQQSITDASPLDAFLAVMEAQHAETERVLEVLDDVVRPWTAPEPFLPYVASWVDLDEVLSLDSTGAWRLESGPGALRSLVAAAADLARWRGTSRGLTLFLESSTGVAGFRVDEEVIGPDGRALPFTVRVVVPSAAVSLMTLVERVVDVAKPAYLRCVIEPASADPALPSTPASAVTAEEQ